MVRALRSIKKVFLTEKVLSRRRRTEDGDEEDGDAYLKAHSKWFDN